MKIILNNNPEVLEVNACTVSDLLRIRNFTFKMLIVKINGKLVRKDEFGTAEIHDGDNVSVLHLISGG